MKLEYCSSNISYTTWIAPLTVYEVKDNTVYILVQLRASLEHIEEKYLLPFKVCIAEVTGIEFEVAFVTDNEAVIQEKKENIIKKNRVNAIYEKANLNPKYTFDTFVVGVIRNQHRDKLIQRKNKHARRYNKHSSGSKIKCCPFLFLFLF